MFNEEEASAIGCSLPKLAENDLKTTLEGLARHLFGIHSVLHPLEMILAMASFSVVYCLPR